MHSTDANGGSSFAPDRAAETLRSPNGDGAKTAASAQLQLAEVLTELAEARAREAELSWQVQRLHQSLAEAYDQSLRYRELFEYAPDGYLITDLAGIILDANHAVCRMMGCARHFLIGKPLPLLVVARDRSDFYTRLGMLSRQPVSIAHWEVILKPVKGSSLNVDLAVSTIDNGTGQARSLRWQVRDISNSKMAQLELHNQKEFAGRLSEMAHVLVLLLDASGRIQFVNEHCQIVSGFRHYELLGRPWDEMLLDERERQRFRAEWAPGLRDSSCGTFHGLRTRDGRQREVEWQCMPLSDFTEQMSAILVVGHDVTELHEAQKKMLQMERLAAIGQMMAGLAHESRNALQRSHACLAMLRWRCSPNPEVLDLVERVQHAQNDLLRLYEGARAYAAPIQLELQPCDLGEVCREVWRNLLELCPERDAQLCEETEGIDLVCRADRFRLGQVFRNLMENALAACTDPMRVTIACQETSLAGAPALQIILHDNGPGFDAKQMQHLFEPFHTTKVKGSGLGMSIAKRIVEAHGGQISVSTHSQPGAEILMILPRRPK